MAGSLQYLVGLLSRMEGAGKRCEARVHPGPAIGGIRCNRGSVVDFSTRGMRLRTRRRVGAGKKLSIVLETPGTRVSLAGTCVWCRREGLGRWLVGLCFEELTQTQCAALQDLVRRFGVTIPFEERGRDAA